MEHINARSLELRFPYENTKSPQIYTLPKVLSMSKGDCGIY